MNQYQACLDSLNAFFIRIPNIVTKFQNVDIFNNMCYILVLSSAHARRIVRVKCHVFMKQRKRRGFCSSSLVVFLHWFWYKTYDIP